MRTTSASILIPMIRVAICCAAARGAWVQCRPEKPAALPADLVLGAAAVASRPRRKTTEEREAVFSNLGRRLSGVRTPREAGLIMLEAADVLWQWDACVLDLCSANPAVVEPILRLDTVNGRRREIPPGPGPAQLGAFARQALKSGPQLILRPTSDLLPADVLRVGDEPHPPGSVMCVPVHKDSQVIGLLSLQSHRPNAYADEDLHMLQALADHCGGAFDRLRAEAALRESNERLRMAMAAGKMGTWTRELVGQDRILWSPELEAILGLKPGEFPGTEQALYEFIHPEDRDLVRQAFARAMEMDTDYEAEFRILPRGRSPGWMLGRGRAYYDEGGNPVRLVGVAIDITARKEAEQQVRQLNVELERRVLERTAQLESTNQELEAFAYSVSHDLRAPLRSIRGFTEVMFERGAGRLDAEMLECLRRVCDSSQHMARLIDDLLKLSRVGRSALRWRAVNLSALAAETAAELRRSEPARAVRFVIQPDLRAEGDEHLLQVLLDNLLGNAWKFTCQRPEARIEFGFATKPEPAFFVRDNGVGFDPARAGRLFGVFQRFHTAAEFPGTGIGLATVQRIVKRHRGRVWADAAVNRGATFYFTLPDTRDFEL